MAAVFLLRVGMESRPAVLVCQVARVRSAPAVAEHHVKLARRVSERLALVTSLLLVPMPAPE